MYSKLFVDADAVVAHCKATVQSVPPQLQQKYAGFVCVYAVSIYEMAIKEVFIQFCKSQHHLFGSFFESKFEKINARITTRHIKDDFLKHFGQKYVDEFDDIVDSEEVLILRNNRTSMKGSYKNLITWRHSFAHTGSIPSTSTLNDVCNAYEFGKNIIHCLNVVLN